MITVTYRVDRVRRAFFDVNAPRGSGYCADWTDTQHLMRELRVLGVRVWSWEVDREEVPAWASAQSACLGFTDWRSKFAEHIGGC